MEEHFWGPSEPRLSRFLDCPDQEGGGQLVRTLVRSLIFIFSIIRTNWCLILVCMWRHGGHVGGQEQKHFAPLGTKLYFRVNSARKNSVVWPPNMTTLSRGYKPRIANRGQVSLYWLCYNFSWKTDSEGWRGDAKIWSFSLTFNLNEKVLCL